MEEGNRASPSGEPLKQKHGGRGDPRSSGRWSGVGGPVRGLEHCAEESGSLPRHLGNLWLDLRIF